MGYGVKIKKLLKKHNLSIKELSTRTGISLNTLYSITKRDSDKVDIGILVKIATCLEIDITELVDSDSTHYMDYMDALNEYDYKQNMNKRALSSNLNYLLGRYHLSLSELSKDLNIDKPIIEKWITGEILPKQNDRQLLENYFNLEENSLINEIILGQYDEKPTIDDIDVGLINAFKRMGLENAEIEGLNKYIDFLKSKGKINIDYIDEE